MGPVIMSVILILALCVQLTMSVSAISTLSDDDDDDNCLFQCKLLDFTTNTYTFLTHFISDIDYRLFEAYIRLLRW